MGGLVPEIVVLDGDVENSTFTESFGKKFPSRFIECFIAEQTMIGVAGGLASLGKIPFVSTFSAFLTRAYDQIRVAGGISGLGIKIVGTHSGVSIGEDGASQMGLEDIASMRAVIGSVVLSPCDAVSTERLIEKMVRHPGFCYMRAARVAAEVLYDPAEDFEFGGARLLSPIPLACSQSSDNVMTLVATGVTVFEAINAANELRNEGIDCHVIDAYSIKPLARDLILSVARTSQNRVITIEDHYSEGGLGDAVAGELSFEGIRVRKLAIRSLPHSGRERELFALYGIDKDAIKAAVREELTNSLRKIA